MSRVMRKINNHVPEAARSIRFSKNVLYDTQKAVISSQQTRVDKMIKTGRTAFNEVKNKKKSCHLELDEQLISFKKNMSQFYKQHKINIITEKDLKNGLGEIE